MMEIRLLQSRDMAKLGCMDCAGCSDCCRGMGTSVLLDPYDAMQLCTYFDKSFDHLIGNEVELHVEDGLILPSLAMQGEQECCTFLDEVGRCSIHEYRPGLCRLFPLGRDYSTGALKYFLLENACSKQNRSKVKIEKWLNVPDLQNYEQFLTKWHALLKELREKERTEEEQKTICTLLLQRFYLQAYPTDGFYEFFDKLVQDFPIG